MFTELESAKPERSDDAHNTHHSGVNLLDLLHEAMPMDQHSANNQSSHHDLHFGNPFEKESENKVAPQIELMSFHSNFQGFQNTNAIMNYFVNKGLTPAQAAGIVGNIDQESGGNPDQHQFGGGPGYGLCQWEAGARKNDLQRFANQEHKPISDLNMQLDFIWHEMNGSESGSLRALRGATNARQAADIFERTYERAGTPNNWARENYAQQALAQWHR